MLLENRLDGSRSQRLEDCARSSVFHRCEFAPGLVMRVRHALADQRPSLRRLTIYPAPTYTTSSPT